MQYLKGKTWKLSARWAFWWNGFPSYGVTLSILRIDSINYKHKALYYEKHFIGMRSIIWFQFLLCLRLSLTFHNLFIKSCEPWCVTWSGFITYITYAKSILISILYNIVFLLNFLIFIFLRFVPWVQNLVFLPNH
jgi:hypothetical protein